MRILLLHNPSAGDSEPAGSELVDALEARGHEAVYRSLDELSPAQALAEAADLVAVAGGDGTVGKIARRLAGSDRIMTVLPCGTANNIARHLRFTRDPIEIIDHLDDLEPRGFDIGMAKGPWGNRVFLEGAGFGLFPQLMPFLKASAKAQDFDDPREQVSELRTLLADLLASFEAREWRIEVDGQVVEGRFLLIEALNIGTVGPRLELAPDADSGDGLLDLVCLTEDDREPLLALLENEPDETAKAPFQVTRASRVTLEWDGSAAHIDSDVWAAGKQGLGKIKRPKEPVPARVRLALHP
ncbi:MAG TPA: diacylglycerol kinase family protein, partial [Gammaproteobacteria bacterium]|nr:diacylglycerol kinase family protein [Gammaproteobacteria bacterium]